MFNLAMFGVGGAALAWMLRRVGWDELRAAIFAVGGWAGVVLALELVSMALDARAWHVFMRPEARMVSYVRVLATWASGRALNVLTPFGALGEAAKATMLGDHAPRARVVSSLVLWNVTSLYLSTVVIVIGIPVTLLLLELPRSIEVSIAAGVAVLVPAMVVLGIMIQRGALATAVGLLHRLRLVSAARAVDWQGRVVEIDRHVRELHHPGTTATYAGIGYLAASKLLSYAATLTIIGAVGVPLTPALVVGVLSVGVLIRWMASVVPLGLGLADGSNYALYAVLGATGGQGLIVTMLERARSIAVAILGLGAMAVLNVLDRIDHARQQRRLRAFRDRSG